MSKSSLIFTKLVMMLLYLIKLFSMNNKGGKREGSGRKTKAKEDKVNTVFINALKTLYSTDSDDKAKENFIIELSQNIRGKIFIAEHLFGKPKEYVRNEIQTVQEITMELTAAEMGEITVNY
jgi:hypothetical protein